MTTLGIALLIVGAALLVAEAHLPTAGVLGVLGVAALGAGVRPQVADGLRGERRHSHSIVPGGFDVMSSTTRLTSRISLIMREAICSSRS